MKYKHTITRYSIPVVTIETFAVEWSFGVSTIGIGVTVVRMCGTFLYVWKHGMVISLNYLLSFCVNSKTEYLKKEKMMFKMILNLFTRQKWKLQISSSQYFIVNTLMLPELLARIHFS